MTIRLAELKDLNSIVKIYNQAIIKGHSTADTEVFTLEQKLPWFEYHYENKAKHPIFVFEKDNNIVAWGSVSEYRPGRKALESTVEVSYYVHNDHQGQGIGKKLLEYIIPGCAPSTCLAFLELHSGDSWCKIFRIGVDTSSDLISSAPLPESALRFTAASAPALFFFTTCVLILFTPYYLLFIV